MKSKEVELKFPLVNYTHFITKYVSVVNTYTKQSNHYFKPLTNGSSARTRQTGKQPAELIVKTGKDPINGSDRVEYTVPTTLDLPALDTFVTEALGYPVLAKWGRYRHSFTVSGLEACIDNNTGYGAILELEGPDEATIMDIATNKLGLKHVLTKAVLDTFLEDYVANWEYYYYAFMQDGSILTLPSRQALDKVVLSNA